MGKVYLLFIALLQLLIKFCLVQAKATVINGSTVAFQDCYTEDLRNVLEFHNNPVSILINHCHLPELPNAIFIKLPMIRHLEISESKLAKVHDYALNGMTGLESLTMRQNNISVLKSWCDHDLMALSNLDLRRNFIREIKENALKKYPNLTRLNLAVNSIERIDDGAFKHVTALKYLNLGKNLLTFITDQTFIGLHKLTHLSLHHNRINFVDYYAFNTQTHLKSLQLQGNLITIFESEYVENLSRLSFLNISHNSIDKLGEKIFKRNAELKVLDMSYNLIEEVPEKALLGLQSLEVLNISHNSITELNNYVFEDLMELIVMDLSCNNLTEINNDLFAFITKIKMLNLSRNQIDDIDDNAFKTLNHLTSLDLSFNRLTNDGFLWPTTEQLQYLNMSNNNYKHVNMSLLHGLTIGEMLDNPWDCQWLVHEMIHASVNGVIHFGRDYVLEHRHGLLLVPGVQCFNQDGIKHNLIVLDKEKANEDMIEFKTIQKSSILRDPISGAKIDMNDEGFDYKTTLLWLGIAIFVVFGAVKILKVLLRRSERNADEWKRNSQQHVDLLSHKNENEFDTTNKTGASEKTEIIEKVP